MINTPENLQRILDQLVVAAHSGRDISELVSSTGLSDRDMRLVIQSLTRRITQLQTLSRLSSRINELELNLQGTSSAEQRRIQQQSASSRRREVEGLMRYAEQLGSFGLRQDRFGNFYEMSSRDYLAQRFYNRYAEFDETGHVSNRDEARERANNLADAQIRQERIEENQRLQERTERDQTRRRSENISARSRYRDAMREIHDPSHMRRRSLYESFLEVDELSGKSSLQQRKAAAKKAREILAAEKANTKGVNENTKALAGLRAFLGPYAKLAMPYYSARLVYQNAKEDTSSSLARVSRRTYGGIYGASPDRRGYRRMFQSMSSYGASESDIMREYAGQKKWASTLMFGMGLDKIEALAMVLGKAPGPAEMRDPELMQRWLRENMRGITDIQAMQLSAMGVASDSFIESARKGEATDVEGRAARIHTENKTLGEMATNPFRRLQYAIGRDFAYDIAQGGMIGKIATGVQFGSFLFGSLWDAIANVLPGEKEVSLSEQNKLIPRQTSVTVNINGNVDSEERAHSFAEQIGAEVRNAEK